MRLKVAYLLSTWFGCGRSPKAPGTVGSAAAVLIAIVLHRYLAFGQAAFAILAIAAFLPAVWAAGAVAADSGRKDPQFVVIDEVIGQWLALAGAASYNWTSYLAAFALFRLFDIWKPPPVRQLEALPGGWGINLDDVMAGLYGALVLFLAGRFNL